MDKDEAVLLKQDGDGSRMANNKAEKEAGSFYLYFLTESRLLLESLLLAIRGTIFIFALEAPLLSGCRIDMGM